MDCQRRPYQLGYKAGKLVHVPQQVPEQVCADKQDRRYGGLFVEMGWL